jgi:DNA-binding SARP family transcriptional activator/TolB-like protein
MIELFTLGSLDLRDGGGGEIRSVLAQPKRLALLAYLATAAPGGFVRRDTLLAMFWPESSDEHARGAFRQAVLYLRRSLGDGVLVNRAEDELGIAPGSLRCDAAEFMAALGRGDLAGAVSLYRGDLLAGLFVADAPEFERWLAAERATLRGQAGGAAWSLADVAGAAGDRDSAVAWARRAVELSPLDELGVRRLITLLDERGDRAGAVRAYEELTRRLTEELDLEPAPETRALVAGIRRRTGGPPPGDSGPDTGPGSTPSWPGDEVATDRGGTAPAAEAGGRSPEAGDGGGGPVVEPVVRPRRTTGRIAVVGAIAVLGVTGLGYLALPGSRGPDLEPRRVAVMPFDNRTGDPSLAPVSNMAADWIVQGLVGRGALEVVPITAALHTLAGLGVPVSETAGVGPDPGPVARETGAGTAVTGSYYRQGDSIRFQARIVDVTSGRVIAGIGPLGSPVDMPLDGIDRLRLAVLAALAPLSDERATHVRLVRAPPSYEAYRAYVSGFESFVRLEFPAAARHFQRASEEDSTFTLAAIAAAIMHTNVSDWAGADSIIRRVERVRDDLGAMEAATLDMVGAWLRGDDDAAYQASRRQAVLAPGSIGEYQVANQALRLNRPRETVRVLTAMGPERGELRGYMGYWRELTTAHHMLGNHRLELKAARRARELYPGRPAALLYEARALVALGRVVAIERLIEERMTSGSTEAPSAGALMAAAARELRAHGHHEPARTRLRRSLEWYRGQGPGDPGGDPRWNIAIMLYELEEWEEAWVLLRELAAEDPGVLGVQGLLGAVAARRGDRAEAERIDGWLRDLDRPYLRGANTLWRARIAAVLGEQDRAIDLLRDAFAQGVQYNLSHHVNVDLRLLAEHPHFRALMRPKG